MEKISKTTWRKMKLGDVMEKVIDNRGKTPPLSAFGIKMIEVNQLSRNLRYPNFTNGQKQKFVSEETYDKWFRSGHPKKGDILISTVGTIAQWNLMAEDNKYCIAQNVVALRPDLLQTDSEFLRYYFNQRKFVSQVYGIAIGVAQPSVRLPHFLNLEIILPPLPEQKRIAGILSAFDEKIELNNKINQALEQLVQAIFKEWFVNFHFPGHEKVEMVNSELGKIPKGWGAAKIKEMGNVVTGKTPSTAENANFGSGHPFVTIPDMQDIFVIRTERFLSALGHSKMKNLLLPKGTISVSCIATVGLVSILSEPSFSNQQINSVKPFQDCYRYFLYLLLKNKKRDLQLFGAGGTATLIINKTQFENLDLIKPTDSTLKKFDVVVSALFENYLNNLRENERLIALRDLILPELMKGNLI